LQPRQYHHTLPKQQFPRNTTYRHSALATLRELPLQHWLEYPLAPTATMPRLAFSNPFKKHDASEFPGVVIPLDQGNRRASINSGDKKDDASRASSDGVQSGGARTLESLRAEVDSDIAAGGHDTAYDRELIL